MASLRYKSWELVDTPRNVLVNSQDVIVTYAKSASVS